MSFSDDRLIIVPIPVMCKVPLSEKSLIQVDHRTALRGADHMSCVRILPCPRLRLEGIACPQAVHEPAQIERSAEDYRGVCSVCRREPGLLLRAHRVAHMATGQLTFNAILQWCGIIPDFHSRRADHPCGGQCGVREAPTARYGKRTREHVHRLSAHECTGTDDDAAAHHRQWDEEQVEKVLLPDMPPTR